MKTHTIAKIDKERIYQTIIHLEGPRHPLGNMDALNATADYIAGELTAYGLEVEMQEFNMDFETLKKLTQATVGTILEGRGNKQ